MRLDHLLSREKAEAETRTPKPRSIADLSEDKFVKQRSVKDAKKNVNERSEQEPLRKLPGVSKFCIVFRVRG